MVTKEKLLLFEKQLVPEDLDTKNEHFVIGELDNFFTLAINRGTITTSPVRRLVYNKVKELRVYGDHEVEFPREGMKFSKNGERPIESITVEEHPQTLIIRGNVQPVYTVEHTTVNPDLTASGQVINSRLRILKPTSFDIWAEYIPEEEARLLKNGRNQKIDSNYNLSAIGSTYGLVTLIVAIYYTLVLSPNVTLTFPDGRVDKDSGAQVMRLKGKINPSRKSPYKASMITRHHEGDELLKLPDRFSVEGDFSLEGTGQFTLPNKTLTTYGGNFSGRLYHNQGKATLLANAQI